MIILSSKIDWKKLPRRDIIVLKIEKAASYLVSIDSKYQRDPIFFIEKSFDVHK